MVHRSILKSVVFVLAIEAVGLHLGAQPQYSANPEPATRARRVLVTGIRTERLMPKDLQRWETIKAIALSTDNQGWAWHATLAYLWKQLEASGHTVYIELFSGNNPNNGLGGVFRIERLDPLGFRHTAVIRLYLVNIDRAYVGLIAARPNGFIPFENLSREERYVEVLGHELAHALWILSDLQRATLVRETVEQTNELFMQRRGQVENDPLLLQRLYERDLVLEELEAQAEAVETVIWQELMQSKPVRANWSKAKYRKHVLPSLNTVQAAANP